MRTLRNRRVVTTMGTIAAIALLLAGCSAGATKDTNDSGTASPDENAQVTTGSDAGPAASTPPETAPADTTVTIGLALEPVSLDFTTQDGAAIPQVLLDNIYETLVTQNDDGDIAPGLAESWTVSDDGKTYEFQLRENVTFSDGVPFTADDAVFSINYVKDSWSVRQLADVMNIVETAEAVSPTLLRVTLESPSNLWLFKMTTRIGAMMSPDHIDDLATTAIGTGPYIFDGWVHGETITLTRNDTYWGTPAATKTVIFKYFEDPTALNNALLTGEIQVIGTVTAPHAVAQFEDASKYRIIEGTTNGKVMMGINNARPPFDDLRVRQAINYALDEQAILDAAWAGYGTLIGSHEVPTDPWFVDLADRYPHDVDKAKDLLADAGHSDLELTLTIASTLPYAVAAAPIIVSQLEQAGITANVDTISWDSWLENVFGGDHDYDLTIVNHVEQYDVVTVFSGGSVDYYTQYTNPQVTAWETDGNAADYETFIADFRKVVTTLADDAAAAWLWAFSNLMVTIPEVSGLPENLAGESLKVFNISVDEG